MTSNNNNRISPLAWQFLCLTISTLIFLLILTNRSSLPLRVLSTALRTGFGIVIPLATLVIYGTFRLPGQTSELVALTATMSLFGLALAGLWISGDTQSVVLNGLIPLTDAAGYYSDATRLLYGADVSNFTAMRPFFAGMLSFFLWLSQRNLMTAVGIFTGITGFACYLASREIQKTHGTEVAAFFLMLMFLYYRHHSGTTMSESLGVPISLLGVGLLWRGASKNKEWTALFGIAMIALALNIRPGAMFVLPALLLWGGWIFRGQSRFSFKFFGLGVVAILFVFFVNSRMIAFVSNSGGVPFENFAWAFYGLASGGKSWAYVFEANPQLALLKDNEVTPAIYKLAFELILTDPSLIVKGALFYWRMFFSNTWYNAYAFVAGHNYWVNLGARWGMYALNILGIYSWFKKRENAYTSLAVLTALGVLASVPFVPPTDAYRVRLYAATIPFFVILPGLGFDFLLKSILFRPFKPASISIDETTPLAILSATLIAIILIPPVLIKMKGQLPVLSETSCLAGAESFLTRYDEGISFNLHRENKAFIDDMPDFHISVFRRNIHNLPDSRLISAMSSIDPGNTLFYALNLIDNHEAIIVAPTDQLPKGGSIVLLCGYFGDNGGTPYTFFHAEQVLEAATP